MKNISMLICLAVVLSIPAELLAEPYTRTAVESHVVQARVVRDTTFFGRMLKASPVGFDARIPDVFEIDVPRNSEVFKHGRRISVHEVRTGDVIRAEGAWSSKRFVASRLIVNDGNPWLAFDRDRDYRAVEGRVRDIDYVERRFTFDTPVGECTVYADRARVWKDGVITEFDELRPGKTIWVRGNLEGLNIDAERIEISRANHTRDLYMM